MNFFRSLIQRFNCRVRGIHSLYLKTGNSVACSCGLTKTFEEISKMKHITALR